ncbi:prostatic acid phosphatase isoform X2 [Folsomia candida]|uniref:prostatic acid phosphatase isoform X2 n=1 Tax=Folsomia candida TaxID=158441 RepID=UPI000B902D5C|nr:prostatic acid phosphatase isoform X2 [Folsomia candida]
MNISVLTLLFAGLAIIGSVEAQVNLDTLQLVQVLFRHGERVPEYAYPTDPYNSESQWKEGWGQLTEVGKKQEFELGRYLRSRYQTYISDNFVPNEIYTLSSDTDRTIMSAELCLAGIFPTENGTEWNPDLKWQPIPLHVIPEVYDNILRCKKKCPKFEEELRHELYNSPEMKQLNSDNQQLFEYLSNNSGVAISNIDDIDRFWATMMELLGLPLPSWAVPVVHTDNFQYMYNLSMAIKSSTLELKRLRTGPLLDSINSHFHERMSNASSKTKLYIYSAHDTTIVNLLNSLDIFDLQIPRYSSIVMMELHKTLDTNNYFISFSFRNDTQREPYKLKLPICELDCPYEEFTKFVEPMIPQDWDAECQLEPAPSNTEVNPIVHYFIAGGVGLLLLGFAYFLLSKVLCKKKSQDQEGYEKF